MGNAQEFSYYYGIEAEQFSFYRVPRLLIKDERFKSLSSDAKLLYGLMLDRMALSVKNGWFDEENRAYVIYTIDNIREDLGCSKEKAVKVLAELDAGKGIGLVEKKRRGLGKPDIIYVKNFATSEEAGKESANADVSTEVGKADFNRSEKPTSRSQNNRLQEVGELDSQKSENQTSGGRKNRPQEVGISDPNYNNKNDTNSSKTSKTNSIYLSYQEAGTETRGPDPDKTDPMDDVNVYMELVKENIEYDHYMAELDSENQVLYQELLDVICEIVCVKRKRVKIGGEDYPYELVKSKFLKLNHAHLEYVMGAMKKTTTKIANIKAYMITALYNAPSTMNHYMQQEVQHDMFGGGWEKKGIV